MFENKGIVIGVVSGFTLLVTCYNIKGILHALSLRMQMYFQL